jgi:hypothetical protein
MTFATVPPRKGSGMKRLLALLIAVAAVTTAASAQAQRIHVRGTIVSFDAGVLTVATAAATSKVTLNPNFTVQYVVKSDFSHVAAGSWIGCAAIQLPDGTLRATGITIFPPGLTPGGGSGPWDLGPASVMTNGAVSNIADAQVDRIAAHSITITYPDGQKVVAVPPSTSIVTLAKADPGALTAGAHVNVFATKGPDGALSASNVSVGKDGLVPPN